MVAVVVGVGDGPVVAVAVGEGSTVGSSVPVGVTVGVAVAVGVAIEVGVGVGVAVGVLVGVWVGGSAGWNSNAPMSHSFGDIPPAPLRLRGKPRWSTPFTGAAVQALFGA